MFSKNKKVTEIKDVATWGAEWHAQVGGGGGSKQDNDFLTFGLGSYCNVSLLSGWASVTVSNEGCKSSMHEVRVATLAAAQLWLLHLELIKLQDREDAEGKQDIPVVWKPGFLWTTQAEVLNLKTTNHFLMDFFLSQHVQKHMLDKCKYL